MEIYIDINTIICYYSKSDVSLSLYDPKGDTMLVHIMIRVDGESGYGILQKDLKLSWVPSIGTILTLTVGTASVSFTVEELEWSERQNAFSILSSWHTSIRNALVPFRNDPSWGVIPS